VDFRLEHEQQHRTAQDQQRQGVQNQARGNAETRPSAA
jgi:hypothetical protein